MLIWIYFQANGKPRSRSSTRPGGHQISYDWCMLYYYDFTVLFDQICNLSVRVNVRRSSSLLLTHPTSHNSPTVDSSSRCTSHTHTLKIQKSRNPPPKHNLEQDEEKTKIRIKKNNYSLLLPPPPRLNPKQEGCQNSHIRHTSVNTDLLLRSSNTYPLTPIIFLLSTYLPLYTSLARLSLYFTATADNPSG